MHFVDTCIRENVSFSNFLSPKPISFNRTKSCRSSNSLFYHFNLAGQRQHFCSNFFKQIYLNKKSHILSVCVWARKLEIRSRPILRRFQFCTFVVSPILLIFQFFLQTHQNTADNSKRKGVFAVFFRELSNFANFGKSGKVHILILHISVVAVFFNFSLCQAKNLK